MNVNRRVAIVAEINDSEKTCEGWFIYATERRRSEGMKHVLIST